MNSTPSVSARTDAAPIERGGVWRGSLGLAVVTLVGFGFLYSLAGAGLGGVLFPKQAQGSLIERKGVVVGSAFVPQPFAGDQYFASRPSAAHYDPMAAAGSNQARTSPDLRKRVDEAIAAVAAREGISPAQVPADLATQSGGGLDPHISPAAAQVQVARVARIRGLSTRQVEQLVATHTEAPQYGVLGHARVNVLELNLALDALR